MARSSRERAVRASAWLYERLLALYPSGFRRRFGEEMARLFGDLAREALDADGLRRLAGLWLETVPDLVTSVLREHWAGSAGPSQILTSFPDAVFRLGPDGRVLDCYGVSEGLLVVKPEQAVGRLLGQALDAQLAQAVSDTLPLLASSRRVHAVRCRGGRGTAGEIEARLVPLPGDEVLLIVRERGVETFGAGGQQQRTTGGDLEEFVNGLTHHFGNALFGLTGTLDCLEQEASDCGVELLGALRKSTDRLSHLAAALVELEDALSVRCTPQPPQPVVLSAVEACRCLAATAGVTIRVLQPAGLPLVALDRPRLERAFGKLIENAIEHSPAGGVVTVAAAGSPEQLCVSCEIRDSGPGFPTGGLARAVRPFVTRRTGRIGLGLTIALTTIRAHGGKLEAENLAAGGATVSVTLPCEPQLVS